MINFLLWEQNISTRMDKGSKNPISLTVQRREEGELLSCPEKKSRVFLLLEPAVGTSVEDRLPLVG